jgi:hypothetical protein
VGPLTLSRLGVRYQDGALALLVDASVSVSGLTLSLLGLSVTSPLDTFTPSLALNGIGVALVSAPLAIAAAFEDVPPPPGASWEYAGTGTLTLGDVGLTAIGAVADVGGHPAMFVFAQLDAELGGPPFFFVTGLAAGFGYHTALRIPGQQEVASFPLVAWSASPGGAGAGSDPLAALSALTSGPAPWLADAPGTVWGAIGVTFTSFELIRSRALLIAELGGDLTFTLLGLSAASFPQQGAPAYAQVELELEAVLRVADGSFLATALVAPNSYLLDPACVVTGGFAFASWFGDNPHSGDFVLTLGGYSPYFTAPAWYPVEPRLGFTWSVSSTVSVTGSAYFALTPAVIMAGGSLSVAFHDGNLSAWLTAYADVISWWEPFHFRTTIGVSIGASYRMHIAGTSKTLTAELGAQLDLWGPPTGGTVTVHWWVISLTIVFGGGPSDTPAPLDWTGFTRLLPVAPLQLAAVSGWVVLNHLNGSLAVYGPDGAILGQVRLVTGSAATSEVTWEPAPGSATLTVADLTAACPRLGQLVTGLLAAGPQAFPDVLQTIDESLWSIMPAGRPDDQTMSVLAGRPLVVVRVRVGLELQGPPLDDPSWQFTGAPAPAAILDCSFPVRLGDAGMAGDGLVGYLADGDDAHLHVAHLPHDLSDGGSGFLTAIGPGNFVGLRPNAAGAALTVLLDPRAPVHAVTDILPVSSLSVPGPITDAAVQRMAILVGVAPLLTTLLDGTVTVPTPATRDLTAAWLEPTPAGAVDTLATVPADPAAAMPATVPGLRSGWLRLRPGTPAPGELLTSGAGDDQNTLLTYGLATNPEPVGISPGIATLNLVVSNSAPGSVWCDLIVVKFPVGPDAASLTNQPGLISVNISPDTWQAVVSGGQINFTPRQQSPVEFGDNGLLLQLAGIAVNNQVGSFTVSVTEHASTAAIGGYQSRSAQFTRPKGPYSFMISDFAASKPMYSAGEQAVLTWSYAGTGRYEISYSGQYDDVLKHDAVIGPTDVSEGPPFTSKPLYNPTTFVLHAYTQVGGDTVHRYLSTTVQVDVPDILTTQIVAYEMPIGLSGQLNAGNVTAVNTEITGELSASSTATLGAGQVLTPGSWVAQTDGFVTGTVSMVATPGQDLMEVVIFGCIGASGPPMVGATVNNVNTSHLQLTRTDSFLLPVPAHATVTVGMLKKLMPIAPDAVTMSFYWMPMGTAKGGGISQAPS